MSFLGLKSGVWILLDHTDDDDVGYWRFDSQPNGLALLRAVRTIIRPAGLRLFYFQGGLWISSRPPPARVVPVRPPPQLTAAQQADLQENLKRLSADDFATRLQAEEHLADLGPALLPLLEAEAQQPGDLERTFRLRRVVALLHEPFAEAEPAVRRALARPHHGLTVYDKPFGDVLDVLRADADGIRLACDGPTRQIRYLQLPEAPLGRTLAWVALVLDMDLVYEAKTVRFVPRPPSCPQ